MGQHDKKHRRTTPDTAGLPITLQITHPFHPLSGQCYELVSSRWNWGQEWLSFHTEGGQLTSVPVDWTSLSTLDPFVVLSNGRASFRAQDLLALVELIDAIKEAEQKQTPSRSLRRNS